MKTKVRRVCALPLQISGSIRNQIQELRLFNTCLVFSTFATQSSLSPSQGQLARHGPAGRHDMIKGTTARPVPLGIESPMLPPAALPEYRHRQPQARPQKQQQQLRSVQRTGEWKVPPIHLYPSGDVSPYYKYQNCNPWRPAYEVLSESDFDVSLECGEFYYLLRQMSLVRPENSGPQSHVIRHWLGKVLARRRAQMSSTSADQTESCAARSAELYSNDVLIAWTHVSCWDLINELTNGRHREPYRRGSTLTWRPHFRKVCRALLFKGYHSNNPALALNAYIGMRGVQHLISAPQREMIWRRFGKNPSQLRSSIRAAMELYERAAKFSATTTKFDLSEQTSRMLEEYSGHSHNVDILLGLLRMPHCEVIKAAASTLVTYCSLKPHVGWDNKRPNRKQQQHYHHPQHFSSGYKWDTSRSLRDGLSIKDPGNSISSRYLQALITRLLVKLRDNGHLRDLWRLVDGSGAMFDGDATPFNILIRPYAAADDTISMRRILEAMRVRGVPPNMRTWNELLSAYWRNGTPERSKALFALILSHAGRGSTTAAESSLPEGSPTIAQSVVDPWAHWLALVDQGALDPYVKATIDEWARIPSVVSRWVPDRVTMAVMLKGLADAGERDEIDCIWRNRDSLNKLHGGDGPQVPILTGRHHALVSRRMAHQAEAQAGPPDTSIDDDTAEDGGAPDLAPLLLSQPSRGRDAAGWHGIIRQMGVHQLWKKDEASTPGFIGQVCEVLATMRAQGAWPSQATYTLLFNMAAQLQSPLMASVFLDEMRQVDKLPVNARILNAATLNLYDSGALVRILIDAVSQAQYAAFAPNSQCLTSIIRSCIAENKLDAACVALKAMVEAFMVFPSTKCLVRLVRACKRTGRSDLTHEILELIKNNEIKLT